MTPKELMISRYNAFVSQNWDYLEQTAIHQKKEELAAMSQIKWLKLEVINAYDDVVEFKAYYKEQGLIAVLHEKSRFIKTKHGWKYLDGEIFNTKIQRNELCPCGSGKKFKKCCSI
jgi:SEC-C motif-containing protein